MIQIQKISYNNRDYIWDGNKEDFSMFQIKEYQSVEIPEKFTKYCPLTEYSIDSILNQYIYAAHPYELNDPFDCFSQLIDTAEITNDDIEFLENSLKVNINKEKVLKDPESFIEILFELLFEKCGIISVTDSKNENPALWANYANKHKGFSVTYRRDSLNKVAIGPFRIDYVINLEKLKFNKNNVNVLVLYLSTVKSNYWKNENEWRFIGVGQNPMYVPYKDSGKDKEQQQQNRKLFLQENSIFCIKLGFYFFDIQNMHKNNLNEIVINLNKEQEKDLKIKLLNYIQRNKIPLSMTFIDKSGFKFKAIEVEYDYNQESSVFKYKMPIH